MLYSKKAITLDQQISQLTSRGLAISDVALARQQLSNIGYYRLAGYWWSMQSDKAAHIFKPNSRFEDAISLYHFDRDLRLLLFDIIERIEISLRTKLIYHLSHEFDPWWFQDTSIFIDTKELIKTLASMEEEVDRSKDAFIKEHKTKYKEDGRFPPSWKNVRTYKFWKPI